MPADLTPVASGVVRVSWTEGASAGEVREAVEAALDDGSTRVEAHVPTEDRDAQRVASLAGMLREGVARGVGDDGADRVVLARLAGDTAVDEPEGFRRLLNSFLPRKRAIAQLLVRDHDDRVLLCSLTYKRDRDLPGGVVEVGESPHVAVGREVQEELALELPVGPLLLTDWLPAWSGWDDAVCLVFDGGAHDPSVLDDVVREEREIRSADFHTLAEVHELCADYTARRVEAALAQVSQGRGTAAYAESGRVLR